MLFEIAIGDAYGAGFEFRERELIARANTLEGYRDHPQGVAAGCYTDDTQMSLAVADLLLSGRPLTTEAFADAFVAAYARDPRPGYAADLQAILAQCRDGRALLERRRRGSRRNGAAMRSVPLGLLASVDAVEAACRAQTAATHDTAEALLGSRAVALMAHALVHSRLRLDQLAAYVERQIGLPLRGDWRAGVECDAIETVHAVHTLLARHRSLREMLHGAVDFGGDVDSVAAIALGLASLSSEVVADLPDALHAGLENGRYGADHLRRVDADLAARYQLFGAAR